MVSSEATPLPKYPSKSSTDGNYRKLVEREKRKQNDVERREDSLELRYDSPPKNHHKAALKITKIIKMNEISLTYTHTHTRAPGVIIITFDSLH